MEETCAEEGGSDEKVSQLAARFGMVTEGEFATLCDVQVSTLEAWRKRGKGPDWIRAGSRILYADEAIERWLLERENGRPSAVKDVL
jgi:hypothetical protein